VIDENGEFNGMSDGESCDHQLDEWVRGNSIHNPTRDECCPDFSCCHAGVTTPTAVRQAFKDADYDTRMGMLGMFLGGALSSASDAEGDVYIAGLPVKREN
jgi:hypothetical protein